MRRCGADREARLSIEAWYSLTDTGAAASKAVPYCLGLRATLGHSSQALCAVGVTAEWLNRQ